MSNPHLNEYKPGIVSIPGETLQEILDEKGMSQAELAERMGRPKKTINEIIRGKAAITPETAIQLELVLGIPASFWNNREQNYRESLARQAQRAGMAEYTSWMKSFPTSAMVKLGWIKDCDDQIDLIEELLKFFGIASPLQWQAALKNTSFRQSPTFAANPAAVSAWLRRGELRASDIQCAPYDEARFRDSLALIRSLTTQPPGGFVPQLTELCAQAGVAIVFERELPGIRTCGATRWLSPSTALIMLSLRYKTDDHLWFTFFHEAAHILLHGKRDVFLEDDVEVSEDMHHKEDEANQFATEFLIHAEEMVKFKKSISRPGYPDIISFAEQLGIAPGIVVGRLQHDGLISRQNLNRLKRYFQWNA